MNWTVQILTERPGPGTSALAVEVDPRMQRVTLAWRTLGLGSAEVGNRALFRRFLPVEFPDLEPGQTWLEGPEAGHLLGRIQAGYSGGMTWSGDPVGTWTEEAWSAAEELVAGLLTRVQAP